MPWEPSFNPRGLITSKPTTGGGVLVYAPTPTTIPLVGELVIAATFTPAGAHTGHYTPPYVKKCPTAGSVRGIGVCIGGWTRGVAPVKGGVCQVMVLGPAEVLFKGHATAGDYIVVSTAAAGKAKAAATIVAGKTFGVILQSTSTTTKLAYCYVRMV